MDCNSLNALTLNGEHTTLGTKSIGYEYDNGYAVKDGFLLISQNKNAIRYAEENHISILSEIIPGDGNADGVCNVIDLAITKRTVLESDPVTNTIAIHLSDSGITVENDTKGMTSVSGKTVTISASGSYTVDGSMADGQILVNIPDTTTDADDVELILNNVTMTSSTGAPCIYTQSAVKTKLTVTGTNTLPIQQPQPMLIPAVLFMRTAS